MKTFRELVLEAAKDLGSNALRVNENLTYLYINDDELTASAGRKMDMLSEEVTKAEDIDLDEVGYIGYSLYVIAQMHIYHWLSKSGQTHEALGEYYEELQEELDDFTEMFHGKYGVPESDETFTFDFTYDEGEISTLLDEYDSLTNDVLAEFDEVEDAELIGELTDIKELNSKLRFKLKLK